MGMRMQRSSSQCFDVSSNVHLGMIHIDSGKVKKKNRLCPEPNIAPHMEHRPIHKGFCFQRFSSGNFPSPEHCEQCGTGKASVGLWVEGNLTFSGCSWRNILWIYQPGYEYTNQKGFFLVQACCRTVVGLAMCWLSHRDLDLNIMKYPATISHEIRIYGWWKTPTIAYDLWKKERKKERKKETGMSCVSLIPG